MEAGHNNDMAESETAICATRSMAAPISMWAKSLTTVNTDRWGFEGSSTLSGVAPFCDIDWILSLKSLRHSSKMKFKQQDGAGDGNARTFKNTYQQNPYSRGSTRIAEQEDRGSSDELKPRPKKRSHTFPRSSHHRTYFCQTACIHRESRLSTLSFRRCQTGRRLSLGSNPRSRNKVSV